MPSNCAPRRTRLRSSGPARRRPTSDPKRFVMPASRRTVSVMAGTWLVRSTRPGDCRDAPVGPGRPRVGLAYFAVDFGSASFTLTANLPSRIAFSFARTFSTTSFGTFASNVPSGASSLPLCFIVEYGP